MVWVRVKARVKDDICSSTYLPTTEGRVINDEQGGGEVVAAAAVWHRRP